MRTDCGPSLSRQNCHSSLESGLLGIVHTEIITFINIIFRLRCVSLKQGMHACMQVCILAREGVPCTQLADVQPVFRAVTQ